MKYLGNIIAIIVVGVLVWGAIQFKKSDTYQSLRWKLGNAFQHIKTFINVHKHNISMEWSPSRKSPLTFIEKEEALRVYIPEVFGKFDARQWREFWALIYVPIEEKQGSFKVKRYRTKEEIESYLRYKYHNPFAYFEKGHWFVFWNILRISWEDE